MLTGKNLSYEVGGHTVFSDVSISVPEGSKIGLVGPNGAGKTSLLKILAGEVEPLEGGVSKHGLEVGMVPQNMRLFGDSTVEGFVEEATGVLEAKQRYETAVTIYEQGEPEDMERLVALSEAAERLGIFSVDSFDATLASALRKAGLSEDLRDRTIGSLSGGQRTRVALAAIMADKRDVILLDEPTNNLDMQGIQLLEEFINGSSAAFLMVSHDRRFLRNAATSIVELLGGDEGTNRYNLGYEEYVEARAKALIDARAHYEEYEAALKGLRSAARDARIRANSAESGRGRSDNDKLTANYRSGRAASSLAGQAKSLETRIRQHGESAPAKPQEPVSLDFLFSETESMRGQTMLRIEDLTISYSDQDTYGPYSLMLRGKDRVAVTGSNGAGKSTLLRAIMKQHADETVVEGRCEIGSAATVAYIDQNQSVPLPEQSPLDNLLTLVPRLERADAMKLLVQFNLKRDSLTTMRAQDLSGGERAKILLASVAAKKANLLILDEPTNNLDIPTIDALQEALQTYKGALLLVSHDREFIDGIGITETIELN